MSQKKAIVVSTLDPLLKKRIRVRVIGVHTAKTNGIYNIFDDSLPWASPMIGSTNGYVPKVGDIVLVDYKDTYNVRYYGLAEQPSNERLLAYDNLVDYDQIRTLLLETDNEADNEYAKVYYIPSEGLRIECDGATIMMPKQGEMTIGMNDGCGITIDKESHDITIHTDGNVIFDCNKIKFTKDGDDNIISADKLMEIFNKHTHLAGGSKSAPPTEQIQPTMFTNNVII